tara:strand:+ start:92 stop:208 length:117 start_codon:yes stop_codon:yes gene_type:complete
MIREKEGRFICDKCDYEHSAMLSDDEIPEKCNYCRKGG